MKKAYIIFKEEFKSDKEQRRRSFVRLFKALDEKTEPKKYEQN